METTNKDSEMKNFVVFENGKSIKVKGKVFTDGFIANGRMYRYFEASEFLYGDVLFLDIYDSKILPMLPVQKTKLPVKTEQQFADEIRAEIAKYNDIYNETVALIKKPTANVHEKLLKYKSLFRSIDGAHFAYYTQGKMKKVIKNQKIKVDGHLIIAKVDSGANIAVAKQLPKKAIQNRRVYVASSSKSGEVDEDDTYRFPIEINGRILEIEALHRPNLGGYEFLITEEILARAQIDLAKIIEEVPM
jgi:hypothetical protein